MNQVCYRLYSQGSFFHYVLKGRNQLWHCIFFFFCTHFRHPTDEQVRNSDMFRSHIYLKSVPFELLNEIASFMK